MQKDLNNINEVLQRDINVILEEIFITLDRKNIISIFLYGGYGRDEGSWVFATDSALPRPYNDYDIALVVSSNFSNSDLKKVELKLRDLLDVRWIDICQYTKLHLRLLRTSIKNYDFKYASKLIYGRRNVLDLIRTMHSTEIGFKDIETLFITRLWTLLGSFGPQGLVSMKPEEEMFFRNQMAKCILSIVDCVLIDNHSYDASYKRRVTLLEEFSDDADLITLAQWALEEKLFPKYEGMSTAQVQRLYKKTHSLFFKYFYFYLSKYFRRNISLPEDLDGLIMNSFEVKTKSFLKSILMRDNRIAINQRLLKLQSFIVFYYFDMSEYHLGIVSNIMKDTFNFQDRDLDSIRLKVANLRVGE